MKINFCIVSIAFCVLLSFYLLVVDRTCNYPEIETVPSQEQVISTSNYHLPRPIACSHLRTAQDYNDWDPITETYPRNIAWEKCMGVY